MKRSFTCDFSVKGKYSCTWKQLLEWKVIVYLSWTKNREKYYCTCISFIDTKHISFFFAFLPSLFFSFFETNYFLHLREHNYFPRIHKLYTFDVQCKNSYFIPFRFSEHRVKSGKNTNTYKLHGKRAALTGLPLVVPPGEAGHRVYSSFLHTHLKRKEKNKVTLDKNKDKK